MARMPEPSKFTSITYMGWVQGDASTESEHGVLEFSSEALGRLDPELAAFWHDVGQQFRSEQFALTMLRKLLPQIAERFGDDVGTMRFSATPMLLWDNGRYALGHIQTVWNVFWPPSSICHTLHRIRSQARRYTCQKTRTSPAQLALTIALTNSSAWRRCPMRQILPSASSRQTHPSTALSLFQAMASSDACSATFLKLQNKR
jgi:hypothetical protein